VLYKLNIKRQINFLKNLDLSATNRKLILNFINYCFSEGIGESCPQILIDS
jgi:hypothetical protein